ncbi:MAG: phosphoribosylanthranilate isomerase [Phycisphaeraceae bacterium]|nr:phosphoribosylanthranilate isomerase [Phycisphaeraceae bacterium]
MTRTRIKICGFTDANLALAAVNAGADAIGLNFVSKSPRVVTIDQAKIILSTLPAFVQPVAVFCDAPTEQIITLTQELGINTVQLHGKEPLSFANYLSPLKIIKALPFDDQFQHEVESWGEHCQNLAGIIIDAPPKDGLTGGTGVALDWEKLSQIKQPHWPPLILAGGLTPGNVRQAITTVKPYGVDVASGVEIERGFKDQTLIEQFCDAVCLVK